METLYIIINVLAALALVSAGALLHRVWKKSTQKAEIQSQKLKQQMMKT